MSLIGQTLDGRYRLTSFIGSGSTGDVYRADHAGLGRAFAVKVLHDVLSRQPTFASRFKREGKALARLSHPNIVRVFDACIASDAQLYIVMELVEGERLDRSIRHMGAFSLQRTLRIARQLADAIEHAHQADVLHRDLRPANLLLCHAAAGEELKILDFGIAKIVAADYHESKLLSREFAAAEVLPHYKSPEQLRFTRVDRSSDIYAIGCILYELLTGERPFVGSSAEIINGHLSNEAIPPGKRVVIPPALDKLVMTCLAKDPKRRFQSGHELAAALAQFDAKAVPRRNVLISGAAEGGVEEERYELTIALAERLLPVDDGDLAGALQQLRDLQAQRELLQNEADLDRERVARLEDWSSLHRDLLVRSAFADEVAALCSEAEAMAGRYQARVAQLQAEIDVALSAVEEKVAQLLPRVPPSSEAFLLVNRWKRLREKDR